MKYQKELEKYADLLVEVGLNIQEGDKMVINMDEYALDLARLVAKKAYKKGADNVTFNFRDDDLALTRYLEARDEAFESFPEYEKEYLLKRLQDGTHSLSIVSPNPELLKDVDPERIAKYQKVVGLATKEIAEWSMANKSKWCVACAVSPTWAKLVFPDLDEEEAVDKLWQAVFDATRVSMDDPVKAWEEHNASLKKNQDYLNEANFKEILFKGPETDLRVPIVENHNWVGGAGRHVGTEDLFMANIPTEEIFTMPHADKVSGKVSSTKPLSVRGNLVEDFYMVFEDGKVVDFGAKKGEKVLEDLLNTDEGARRLGEVALVPDNSPISNTGILFNNTLFDENASCHLALGRAYAENIEGGTDMSDEDKKKNGMNDSIIHVDFMVGSKDVEVIGVKEDGTEVTLIKDGEWII